MDFDQIWNILGGVWNPIDFQGHRSKVKVTVKFLGKGIRHALCCPFYTILFWTFYRYIDENDSAKSKKKGTKPKLLKVTLTADERSLWNREVDSITMR